MNRLSYFQIHFNEYPNFTIILPDLPKSNGKYSKTELRALTEYAEARGITIITEIDIPGHTAVMTKTYPEIFPNSPYIHIGGDEAKIGEWEKCETTQAYMKKHGIVSVHELYAEYICRVGEMILELGCTPIMWEGFSKEYNDRIIKGCDSCIVGIILSNGRQARENGIQGHKCFVGSDVFRCAGCLLPSGRLNLKSQGIDKKIFL